jgi:BASS family bile acid:Na+ symporter
VDTGPIDNLQIALEPLAQAGVALALVLLMTSIALGLRIEDFTALSRQPRWFAAGLLAQVVGLPFVTWLVLRVIDIAPSLALGMLVVACCPGGAISNFLTWLARGNVAYSVSLTAASSALAAVLTPASILFWTHINPPTAALLDSIHVSPLRFLGQTLLLLLLPLVAGMLLSVRAPGLARRARPWAARAGTLLLLAVIAWGGWQFLPRLLPALPLLAAVAIGHNALAFTLGALTGRLLDAPRDVRRALVFELGIQNSGLALVILLGQLQGLGGATAIAALWGVWHIVAGGFIVACMRTFDRWRARA